MSEWDPWRRYWREQEKRLWDPWYRYEYEQQRLIDDPCYRYEKERERMQWDPYFRMEKQMSDPFYRFEEEQKRLHEDPWCRELHRMEYGLQESHTADPAYVIEKETGLGTRPNDYSNPEYRIYMDRYGNVGEKKEDYDSGEFMQKFFDSNWLSSEEIERQLKELEERRREQQTKMQRKRGILGLFRRLFGLR